MNKPLLIYDGDCTFCQHWVGRWKRLTGDRVAYIPFQQLDPSRTVIPAKAGIQSLIDELDPDFRRGDFSKAVHFMDLEGHVSSGAEAVFHMLVYAGLPSGLWAYRHLPGFAAVSEYVYSIVAGHRPAFYVLTRWIWSATGEPK